MSEWKSNKNFFNCVKNFGSLFMYDRNGLGKSPPDTRVSNNNPITAELVSEKLLLLLKELKMKPPYIFIAHSYGAIYAGYFTLKHPSSVKGLLLVDPSPREFYYPKKMMKESEAGMKEATVNSSAYMYKKYSASKVEGLYQLLGFEASKKSLKQLGNIKNSIPVIVISSTGMENEQPLLHQDWYDSQKQWLNKNPISNITQVHSGHFVQLDQPQKVCNALQKILND